MKPNTQATMVLLFIRWQEIQQPIEKNGKKKIQAKKRCSHCQVGELM
jgi:hypothetical protein